TSRVELKQGEAVIPGVKISPNDGGAQIDWTEIPFTSTYSVRVQRKVGADTWESTQELTADRPPLKLDGLQNGYLYRVEMETSVRDRKIRAAGIPSYRSSLIC
ncbi:MAG: hypothetical protein HC888_17055, partial [Candidatus Competibacteraceae bacterium]|nr:hypothetical protein [Candidatus Competibacteraceae bacterium]